MGNFKPPGKVLLSPMAGISDYPFREVCRRFGSQGACIQLLSANALVMQSGKTHNLVDLKPHELADTGIQIFGGDADIMAEGIRILSQYRPAYIDINMGCSVPKIMKSEGGAFLLCEPERSREVFRKAVAATDLPVTVKTRLGPNHDHYTVFEVAQIAQDEGIQAFGLHARTVSDKFGGFAKWEYIARLKEMLEIPVIGNGDLWDAAAVKKMLDQTGCDAALVARGSMGNPWIFREALAFLEGKELSPRPSTREVVDLAESHFKLMVERYGEETGCKQMRKHFGWYLKGFPDATTWREQFMQVKTEEETLAHLHSLKNFLAQVGQLNEAVTWSNPQAMPV